MLKISRRTVYNLIKQGKLPVVKLNRAVRFRETDIMAYIQQNLVYCEPPTKQIEERVNELYKIVLEKINAN